MGRGRNFSIRTSWDGKRGRRRRGAAAGYRRNFLPPTAEGRLEKVKNWAQLPGPEADILILNSGWNSEKASSKELSNSGLKPAMLVSSCGTWHWAVQDWAKHWSASWMGDGLGWVPVEGRGRSKLRSQPTRRTSEGFVGRSATSAAEALPTMTVVNISMPLQSGAMVVTERWADCKGVIGV